MTSKQKMALLLGGLLTILVVFTLLAFRLWQFESPDDFAVTEGRSGGRLTGEALSTDRSALAPGEETLRQNVTGVTSTRTGVQGVVLDLRSRLPMPDVEVVALWMLPGLERPMSRFRGLFSDGLWTDTAKPVEILGSAITQGDGSFEILGLPPGRVFLDARSPRAYLRDPGTAALARGEVKKGLELLASPGGRIVGTVVDPDGQPAVSARVCLRPGLNAFLSQITKRNYRWLETETDADGCYSITGVPAGTGYSITFAGRSIALDERHGIDVSVGETVRINLRGKVGAWVLGRVVDADGGPVAGAEVAMVYLDISRMLFSADGRKEPLRTDSSGYFSLAHVAPGRVAFIAVDDAMAPSNIEELAVVDGGIYQDLELCLDRAGTFSGLVIDQDDQPLSGVKVEVRPVERGRGANAMKMALRVRRVRSVTSADGRFKVQGVTGRSLMVVCRKSGYTTEVRFGVRADQKDLKIKLSQGVTVRGRVQLADGTPVSRFSVRARMRDQDQGRRGEAENDGERGGVTVEFGSRRGRRGWRRGGRGRLSGSRSLPEGSNGNLTRSRGRWKEFSNTDGTFAIHGLPPGRVEVRVRAEGYLDPERQSPELSAGQESEELVFHLQPGTVARGVVLDEATGQPIANATVTAYREKEKADKGGWRLFQMQADPEDFDFLGLAAMRSQHTVLTDSQGRFELKALEGGHKYRFTARHPDLAKASATDVEVRAEGATENIQILVGTGGAMEGLVTGAGRRPLGDAMVVVFCPQSGTLKSSTTNKEGYYRIDGLPSGQYFVFKTRMDEKAQDIGMSAMANMRMKMKAVRRGKVSRVDIHDESENGVRVFGMVRENGKPIARAMITFLGRDREGIFGMGIRAQPSDDQGNYEMGGIKPGDYLVQVSRFRGRPEQTSLTVEIPEGVRDFRYDIDLPDSYLAGRVQDRQGNPVSGIMVQLGIQDGGESLDGMLGLIMRNGVSQARTDKDGNFKIKNVAAGTYRLTASGGRGGGFGGRGSRGRGTRDNSKYGDVALGNMNVNGTTPIDGIVLTLPLAGSITGTVVDGNGTPVANAQINYTAEKPSRSRRMERAIGDLFGLQRNPVRTGADGRFEIPRVTPGKYRVRAEIEGLAPGTADDVVVQEGQPTECQIGVVKGATLKVRVTNIDGSNLPLASISVFDSKGKPLASKVSVMSVFMKLMRGKTKRDSSGWHEIGNIPPDTYTVIIQEKGQPNIEIKRTIRDGEEARWDINMAEELKSHRESKKK